MSYKKKAIPGTAQFNKLAADFTRKKRTNTCTSSIQT